MPCTAETGESEQVNRRTGDLHSVLMELLLKHSLLASQGVFCFASSLVVDCTISQTLTKRLNKYAFSGGKTDCKRRNWSNNYLFLNFDS